MLVWLKRFWLSFFILFALLFIGHYLWVEKDKLDNYLTLNSYYLWIAVVLQILFLLLTAYLWRYNISQLTPLKIKFKSALMQIILLMIGKYLPGKVWGMFARGTQLKNKGLSWIEIISLTLQEQFALVHSAAILAVTLWAVLIQEWLWVVMAILAWFSIGLGRVLLSLSFRFYNVISRWFIKKEIEGLTDLPLLNITAYFYLIIGFVTIWLILGLVYSSVYFAFVNALFNVELILWITLANVVGMTVGFFALFAPGGIGVRESVSTLFLIQFMPLEQAIMASLLFRFWTVCTELLAGILLLMSPEEKTTTSLE
jgi:glycosyltransferase 2 family protein